MSWDKWKVPGADGRAMMELRERSMWQSALNLKYLPQLTDLNQLAKEIRNGHP